jgi:hypothetical protein
MLTKRFTPLAFRNGTSQIALVPPRTLRTLFRPGTGRCPVDPGPEIEVSIRWFGRYIRMRASPGGTPGAGARNRRCGSPRRWIRHGGIAASASGWLTRTSPAPPSGEAGCPWPSSMVPSARSSAGRCGRRSGVAVTRPRSDAPVSIKEARPQSGQRLLLVPDDTQMLTRPVWMLRLSRSKPFGSRSWAAIGGPHGGTTPYPARRSLTVRPIHQERDRTQGLRRGLLLLPCGACW